VEKSTNRPSQDGKWRSFPRVPHLLQYISSGTYFARIKIKGKFIRESLGTTVYQIVVASSLSLVEPDTLDLHVAGK
jgi:hypothetical protein